MKLQTVPIPTVRLIVGVRSKTKSLNFCFFRDSDISGQKRCGYVIFSSGKMLVLDNFLKLHEKNNESASWENTGILTDDDNC